MKWQKRSKPNETSSRRRNRSSLEQRGSYEYYKSQRHQPNEKPIEILDPARSKLRLLPSIIAIIVIICSLLYATTLSTSPKVKLIKGQDPIYRQTEEYQEFASKVMSEDFSSRTKMSINATKIEAAILEEFPELDAAAIRLPVLGRKAIITISARQPAILLSNSTNLFVLDNSGVAVALAKDINSDYLKGIGNIRDESDLDISIGKQVITSDTVNFINQTNTQLSNSSISIKELVLPLSASQLNVRVEGANYYIKFDINNDPRLQAGRYIATKEELARQGITPKEYIDVRVEDKVFYK